MKKLIALAMMLIMCVTMFTACGEEKSDSDLEYVKSNKKLVIGITEYAPMNYYDESGTLIGFDTEFAQMVCEKLGVEAEFQVIDWKAKESMLKAKNIDCIWNGLTVTEERKENMDFTTTYLTNKQVVVINKKDAEKFVDTASLVGAMMSAESGSAGETAILADANLSKANFTASEKQTAALLGLNAGNFEAVVLDYTLAMASCGNGDYADLMIVEGIELADELYAIGFRKGSDLTAEVNKIIDELVADGSLKKLAEKYDLVDNYNNVKK